MHGPPEITADPSRDAHNLQLCSQSPPPPSKSPDAERHAEIHQVVFEALEAAPLYLPRRGAAEALPTEDGKGHPIVAPCIPDQDMQATPRMSILGEEPTVRAPPSSAVPCIRNL